MILPDTCSNDTSRYILVAHKYKICKQTTIENVLFLYKERKYILIQTLQKRMFDISIISTLLRRVPKVLFRKIEYMSIFVFGVGRRFKLLVVLLLNF